MTRMAMGRQEDVTYEDHEAQEWATATTRSPWLAVDADRRPRQPDEWIATILDELDLPVLTASDLR